MVDQEENPLAGNDPADDGELSGQLADGSGESGQDAEHFLSDEQLAAYGCYTRPPTVDELDQFFVLDDEDRNLIGDKRGDANRLGFMLQLTTLRYLGKFLDDPLDVPVVVLDDVAAQLGIGDPSCAKAYSQRVNTKWEHQREIRRRTGWRDYAEGAAELAQWLDRRCWNTGETSAQLFYGAIGWLRQRQIELPGLARLMQDVSGTRSAAEARLRHELVSQINGRQATFLLSLLAGPNRRDLGRVFNEAPALYDRVRPGYPDELFADLVAITRMGERSSVLEVGCGTGQATRCLAGLGCSVTAVEPGAGMAVLARQRLATFGNVNVEESTFEEWEDRGRRFDVLVAASAWHWVDPSIGWRRAHDVLCSGGWMALLGNVVVRRPDEPEVYAETADLHERFSPGNPDWGHPPLEGDVRTTVQGWGLVEDPGSLFGPTVVRWYPTVQWFDGDGFADLLRSTSLYRRLGRHVREPLLDAVAERIRTRMGDRAARRYLSVLRVGRRIG